MLYVFMHVCIKWECFDAPLQIIMEKISFKNVVNKACMDRLKR